MAHLIVARRAGNAAAGDSVAGMVLPPARSAATMPALPDIDLGKVRLEPGRPVCIGRSDDCDIAVRDPQLSRHHCDLQPDPADATRWLIVDRNSKNGTRIDGRRIDGPHTLRDGDRVRLGRTIITFMSADIEPAAANFGKVTRASDPHEALAGTISGIDTRDLLDAAAKPPPAPSYPELIAAQGDDPMPLVTPARASNAQRARPKPIPRPAGGAAGDAALSGSGIVGMSGISGSEGLLAVNEPIAAEDTTPSQPRKLSARPTLAPPPPPVPAAAASRAADRPRSPIDQRPAGRTSICIAGISAFVRHLVASGSWFAATQRLRDACHR